MTQDLKEKVALLGLPWDEYSSHFRGAARGPRHIRKVMRDGMSNLTSENGIDLQSSDRMVDLGDLRISSGNQVLEEIEIGVADILDRGGLPLLIGGDHAVTYPILKAIGPRYPKLTILHFDAHPDLYDSFEGNPYSHACPFARIMEERLTKRLVQVGIRTMNEHQQQQASRFGVEVISMADFRPGIALDLEGPVYISIDMDALDPAFAPGVSHHEPGGLSTREVINIIHNIKGTVIGADVVEVNPGRDFMEITSRVGMKFIKELAGIMLAPYVRLT